MCRGLAARPVLDQLIIDAWEMHEKAEPSISTERLMEMVENATGASPDRQIQALKRAKMLLGVKS